MRILLTLAATCAALESARAQTSELPPIRRLAPPVATSAKSFRSISVVRALPNGRLLVNDVAARLLWLADTALTPGTVVADSGVGATEYGARPAGLVPYRGDSTLFIDAGAPAMYMIDPNGKVTRTMAVPNPRDAFAMVQSGLGAWPGSDAQGRLIYRGSGPRPANETPPKPGEWVPFAFPDSNPIQRVDFVTRKAETVAWYKGMLIKGMRTGSATGGTAAYIATNPVPPVDDYAVLSDGTIAILRADYHIDFVDADGRVTPSPRIPYAWERLSDDAKVALVDSARKAAAARQASGPPQTIGSGASTAGTSGGGGLAGGRPPMPEPPDEGRWFKPAELPDYRPAFRQGSVRADVNGNVWIRTLQPTRAPNVVYDIVNRAGKLVDRVELPADRSIVGFDASAVYLVGREGTSSWLERVKIR
jgi:hypothetical protein